MKVKESTRIEPGELTATRDKVYLAATLIHGKPCSEQCAMFAGGRCSGYCYRWDNGDDVVFRFLLPDTLIGKDTEVVQTPDAIGAKVEAIAARSKRQRNDDYLARRRGEDVPKKKTGPRPFGSIEKRTTTYRATVTINKVVYRYVSPSYDACLQWLNEKRKEAGR